MLIVIAVQFIRTMGNILNKNIYLILLQRFFSVKFGFVYMSLINIIHILLKKKCIFLDVVWCQSFLTQLSKKMNLKNLVEEYIFYRV